MLILHHLGVSQSERIVWLLEELELPYELVKHTRAPLLSPDSLRAAPGNTLGRAPHLEDTDANVSLSESAAICEYIVQRYGGGRLAVAPSDKRYPEYLQWLNYANATLQPQFSSIMYLGGANAGSETDFVKFVYSRLDNVLTAMDERLKENKWLAGDFSVADIMTLYVTSTQRYWGPQVDLAKYTNILRWMKDCGERPAYKRAMEKGDPEMKLLLEADAPTIGMMAAGGVASDHWKKTSASL